MLFMRHNQSFTQHNGTLKDFIKYVYHCTLKFITAHIITPKIKEPDIAKPKSSNCKKF